MLILATNAAITLPTFYFKFGLCQQLCNKQAIGKHIHSTYIIIIYFILFIIYGLTTIKTQTINNQQLDAILGNQDSYSHALTPVEKVLCHFPVGPRSDECAEKKLILLLKLACNTDVRPKTLVERSINDNFVNKPKEQIMLAVLLFGK